MGVKSDMIRARVVPKIKEEAEAIFKELGLTATDAITMFYRQVIMQSGLPFEVRIPNTETRKAIEETKARKGLIHSELDHLRIEFK